MIRLAGEQSLAKWGGAGLGGQAPAEGLRGVWEAAGCAVIVRLESCSLREAAKHGAVRTETRKGMSVLSRSKRPCLFLPSPITTPPTRHLGRKGGMSNGKA